MICGLSIEAQNAQFELNCANPTESVFCISILSGLGTVDLESISTSENYALFESIQIELFLTKLFFTVDASVGGTDTITFDTELFTGLTVIVDIDPVVTISLETITIQAACNGEDGVFAIADSVDLSLFQPVYVFTPTNSIFTLNSTVNDNIEPGTYTIFLGGICQSQSVTFTIPDGSFTVDLDITASYFSCTSDSLDTGGGIPAEVDGLINGGSGDFSHSLANDPDLIWLSDSLVQVQGNLVPGNYLLQSVDSLTGCTSNTPFTVPDSVIVFELELLEIVQIATNGLGTFYLDYGSITVESNLSGYTIDYEWSPGPGNDSVPGTYSELQEGRSFTNLSRVHLMGKSPFILLAVR